MKTSSLVRKGILKYDSIDRSTSIIKQNCDYYYEDGYEDNKPDLNEDGEAYYIVFGKPLEDGRYFSRSQTFLSVEEVMEYIDSMRWNITWI